MRQPTAVAGPSGCPVIFVCDFEQRSVSAHYAVASQPVLYHMEIIDRAEPLIRPHMMLRSAAVYVRQNLAVTCTYKLAHVCSRTLCNVLLQHN